MVISKKNTCLFPVDAQLWISAKHDPQLKYKQNWEDNLSSHGIQQGGNDSILVFSKRYTMREAIAS